MNKLNVMYQSSSMYAPVALTSMCSLFENNIGIDEINVIFLDAGLTNLDKDKIKEICKLYNRTVTFIEGKAIADRLIKAGVVEWNGSYATFYKLFVIDHLELDSVLYIDADTIVEESLANICQYEFGDYLLGMAYSAMTKRVRDFYKLNKWYNAGIIYFNITKWKNEKCSEKIEKVLLGDKCKSSTMIGDESLINVVFSENIKLLELKYNYESSWWLWGWNKSLYPRLGFIEGVNCYTYSEIKSAKVKPTIVHYTNLTTGRPWDRYNDNRAKASFKKYYKMTGLTKKIDFYKGRKNRKSNFSMFMYRLKRRLMPMTIRSKYGFEQHNNSWKMTIDKMQIKEQVL